MKRLCSYNSETNMIIGGFEEGSVHLMEPFLELSEDAWELALRENHNYIDIKSNTTFNVISTNHEILNVLQEMKEYLKNTEYKMMPDYDSDVTGVLEKRKEAREFIRKNEKIG